jgi:hypothetical protein
VFQIAVVAAGLAALGGCGGGSGPDPVATPTPAPKKAIIKVLMDPNPVTAVASGEPDFPWDFRLNLQLSDSGGVAFIVTSMQTTVTSAISGGTLQSSDQNPFVGVKIPALGQETRQFHNGPYRMENFTKEGKVNVKINFVDDAGNASVFDGSVNVQHVGGIRVVK